MLEVALATAVGKAAKRRATAGMAQEDTGEGRIWCERKSNPSPLLIALRGRRRAFSHLISPL